MHSRKAECGMNLRGRKRSCGDRDRQAWLQKEPNKVEILRKNMNN
jgi:hypothetical protein